jgi:hypothetical protein
MDIQIKKLIGIIGASGKKRGVPPGLTIEEARPFSTGEWPPDLPDAPIITSADNEISFGAAPLEDAQVGAALPTDEPLPTCDGHSI